MQSHDRQILRQFIDSVKPLLERGQVSAALQALEEFRANAIEPLSQVEWSEYCYVYARCLFRLGKYDEALSQVKAALRLCGLTAEHKLYASEIQLLGLIKLAQGQVMDAIEAFNEAYAARKRARDFPNIIRPLLNLALAHLAKGDMEKAISVFDDTLASARKYNSQSEIHHCQFAQCVALLLAGGFVEYRKILESVRTHPLDALETAHMSKLSGQLSAWLLDYDTAREELKNAMIVYAREHIQRDYVVCLEYLGMNEFFAGNYAKAKEYYQQVLAMPEPTASAVAQTLRMLTDVYVAERDWKNAKETAIKAEAAITRINERIELAALWRAQAQIAEHDHNYDAARDLFQKSLDLLQQCGARYELALTHLAAGQSTVHSSTTRLEHLQQAKTLFTEMDVSKRITHVEEAIVYLSLSKPQCRSVRSTKNSIEQPEIITQNPDMVRILEDATKLAATDMTILITGETGTGKDLLARYIHCHSRRVSGPFHNQNMATLPAALIEAELFGFRRGAFTGADGEKAGLLESVNGGTFCFNEIGEMSLSMQTKLLDVLESGMVRRLNDNVGRPIDVRFIAVTNRDLEERVSAGKFRCDLLYRLRGAHLHLPPLGDRQDDLPLLTQFFLQRLGFGEYELREAEMIVEQCGCYRYDWPGNVRELGSVLRRSVALTPSRILPELIGRVSIEVTRLSKTDGADDERVKLAAVLERNGGNLTRAAEAVGMPASTFRRRLSKYRLP